MDNRQLAKTSTYDRCLAFLADHNDTFGNFAPLATEAAEATADLVALHRAADSSGKSTDGITIVTANLRIAMKTVLLPLAQTALGWAMKQHDPVLTPVFDISETDLLHGAAERGASLAQKIIDALNDNVAALNAAVGITPASIAAAQAAKDAFARAIKNTPTAQAANTTATASVAAFFPLMDEHFAIIDTYMAGQYAASQPALFAQWTLLREVGHTVRRHTGIHATIKDAAGNALPGVQMTITESGRTAISNASGEAELSKMKAGMYHLTFKNGDVVKELTVTVGLGVMADVGVVFGGGVVG